MVARPTLFKLLRQKVADACSTPALISERKKHFLERVAREGLTEKSGVLDLTLPEMHQRLDKMIAGLVRMNRRVWVEPSAGLLTGIPTRIGVLRLDEVLRKGSMSVRLTLHPAPHRADDSDGRVTVDLGCHQVPHGSNPWLVGEYGSVQRRPWEASAFDRRLQVRQRDIQRLVDDEHDLDLRIQGRQTIDAVRGAEADAITPNAADGAVDLLPPSSPASGAVLEQ